MPVALHRLEELDIFLLVLGGTKAPEAAGDEAAGDDGTGAAAPVAARFLADAGTAAEVDDWQVCGSADGWDYTSTRPNLPRDTYPLLVQHMRVLIYNGDADSCVPYKGNEERCGIRVVTSERSYTNPSRHE